MKYGIIFLCMACLLLAACTKSEDPPPAGPAQPGQLYSYAIKPSATNPAITLFDSEHYVYLDTRVPLKNKLLVFFPGTFAAPGFYSKILKKAAAMGYHSIGLMYSNSSNMYIACTASLNNACFSLCRLETFDGTDYTPSLTVTRNDCIEDRLVKLLQYLQQRYPEQNWQQFLNGTAPVWSKCVLAGHSQGGGHAQYIGKIRQVDRVASFSSIDYNTLLSTSANWVSQPGLTAGQKYYSFHHPLDEIFAYANVQQQWQQMGLTVYGSAVNIDSVSTPYGNSHTLITRAQPAFGIISPYHNITSVDPYMPQNAAGDISPAFLKAWEYLLGN